MRYEGTVYRPPSEANSLLIQATIGCPHNKCSFCSMYKQSRFRIRELADIKEDLLAARQYYGEYVESLFFPGWQYHHNENGSIARNYQLC